jgi:hypothetical protein
MAKIIMTASEFRLAFKDVANERQRVEVTRNGQRMGAWVTPEDLDFLEKHRAQPTARKILLC